MKDKSQDIVRQFQILNQVLRDEAATLREELALQKLETAVALMQLANKNAREVRALSLHPVHFTYVSAHHQNGNGHPQA